MVNYAIYLNEQKSLREFQNDHDYGWLAQEFKQNALNNLKMGVHNTWR